MNYGVFAKQQIESNTEIGKYEGEVLDKQAYLSRYPEENPDYTLKTDYDTFIDAQDPRKAGITRWMNCTGRGTTPNVESQSEEDGTVIFVTIKEIQPGEELLWDYGDNYEWNPNERRSNTTNNINPPQDLIPLEELSDNTRKKWITTDPSRSTPPENKKRKRGRPKKTARILVPSTTQDQNYLWKGLEVKKGEMGYGVFSTMDLPPGLMIPIIGRPVNRTEAHAARHTAAASHLWVLRNCTGGPYAIDGNPGEQVQTTCGSRGLAISMMVNEPNHKAPNCISKVDHIVTGRKISKGE